MEGTLLAAEGRDATRSGALRRPSHFAVVHCGAHVTMKHGNTSEKLKSALARGERMVVQGDYKLVRHTRSGARPPWTWRMTEETYRAVQQRVIESVRKKDDHALRQLVHSLYRAPGFAGVRR